MPSREYLEEILRRVKGALSPDDFAALNRAAIPRAGGRASWREPGLTELETVAIRELRPAMLQQAQDDELAQIWNKLTQWHRRANRRGLDGAPFERAAGHVLQEMAIRGMGADGPLAKGAYESSTLEARLGELPDQIVMEREAVAVSHDDLELYVAARKSQHAEAAIGALADVGVPALMDMVDPSDRSGVSLYDLALVRSKPILKSAGPPEWIVKQQYNGAMVALMAPLEVQAKLVEAGVVQPEDAEGLHVTLLYLGEAATLSQPMTAAIEHRVQQTCAEHLPLRVRLSGVGRFDTAVFALASAVGMSQLQADLERAVSGVVHIPSEHGFVPHMTLGRGGDDIPDLTGLDLGWAADSVTIKVGGSTIAEFPLAGKEPAEVAPGDEVGSSRWSKMIRHEPAESKPWALYARDGSMLLGRHETREQAEAQELAIEAQKKSVRVLCSSEPAKQVIYYVVSEPFTKDYHGHRIAPDDIEQALWSYMAGDRKIHWEHGQSIDGRAVVVEGYVAPCELKTFHGKELEAPVPEGASIVGIHYTDRAIWEKLSQEEHGLSWGGFAKQEVV